MSSGTVGSEHRLAARRPGRGRQAPGRHLDALPLLRLEAGREQLRQRFGIDQEQRLLGRDELLLHQVGGDDHRGVAGPLAATRLQHEQPVVLDGELEVLDVLVVLLQPGGDLPQLRVGLRHHLFELADRPRRADAGDHVLALRVDEELAVELLGASGGVAGEADAGRRAVAGVAEDHHLDVDGGADAVRDVVDAPVLLGARVVPRAEHGVAGHPQLVVRILWERLLRLGLDDALEALDHLAEGGLVEIGVDLRAGLVLDGFELVLEVGLGNLEHDRAEHLDEAAVAVEGEAAVRRARLEALDCLVVEAEVEDRVHHPGHRELGAGAYRDQQRVLRRA
jgi:hypothetical protein